MSARRLTLLTGILALALGGTAHGAEVVNHKPFKEPLISGVIDPEAKPPLPILDSPCGVAVKLTGDLFVADYRRHSILTTSNPAVKLPPNTNGPCALAADPFNLYVAYWHGGVFNPATEMIDPRPATGIAVGPETFDLYINHRTSVDVYPSPVTPGSPPALEIGKGSLEDAYGVAVSNFPGSPGFASTAGFVYVGDDADDTVKVFDPSVSLTVPVKTIDGKGTAAGRFVSLADTTLALDQSNGHLFVVDNLQPGFEHPIAAISEFNAAGIYRGELDHEFIHGEPTGITVNESLTTANGDVYVTSGNGSGLAVTPPSGVFPEEMGELLGFGLAGKGKKLKATLSGSGSGTVTSEPAGINCPGACEAELNEGAVIKLTAAPKPGSAFVGWSGACSGAGACSVALNGESTVNAEFGPAPALNAAAAKSSASAGTDAADGTAAADALRVGRVSSHGRMVVLHVTAPGPGTIVATGDGLNRVRAGSADGGSVTLRLHLNRRGRRALAKSKTNRLSMRVAFAFKPSDGASGSVVGKTVTFK